MTDQVSYRTPPQGGLLLSHMGLLTSHLQISRARHELTGTRYTSHVRAQKSLGRLGDAVPWWLTLPEWRASRSERAWEGRQLLEFG